MVQNKINIKKFIEEQATSDKTYIVLFECEFSVFIKTIYRNFLDTLKEMNHRVEKSTPATIAKICDRIVGGAKVYFRFKDTFDITKIDETNVEVIELEF